MPFKVYPIKGMWRDGPFKLGQGEERGFTEKGRTVEVVADEIRETYEKVAIAGGIIVAGHLILCQEPRDSYKPQTTFQPWTIERGFTGENWLMLVAQFPEPKS